MKHGRPEKRSRTTQRTYMDDRTIVAKTPKEMMERVRKWHEWSKAVELIENESKNQFLPKTPKLRKKWRQNWMRQDCWNGSSISKHPRMY